MEHYLALLNLQAIKRAKLMTLNNEEDDKEEEIDDQRSKLNENQTKNDSSTTEEDGMPDGATIDKYLEMWDVIYSFVSKMVS